MKRLHRLLSATVRMDWRHCRVLFAIFVLVGIPFEAVGLKPLSTATSRPTREVSAIMLSDIHFDPFQDPAKVHLLADTAVRGWSGIVDGPPSAEQASAFARVRDRCGKEVFDTSPALFASTLTAARSHRNTVTFAVLTGDLIAHDFFCRFDATLPGHSHEEAEAFLTKTMEYVIQSLSRAVSPKPLYVALGNNDSDCGDYRLDPSFPVKMIPSISPVAGNRPSFLLAKIDASTAVMSDYVQYVAPSTADIETAWSPTYSFRRAYQEPSFSAPALEDLFTRFGAYTPQSRDQASRSIERYSSGAPKYGIAPVWNSYRCVLSSMTADQLLNRACPATEPSEERK